MAIAVRKARADDVDELAANRVDFLREIRGEQYRHNERLLEATTTFLAAEMEAGRLHTWLAESDETGSKDVAGMISFLLWSKPPVPEDLRTRVAHVVNFYVLPAHRRRGIARELLSCAMASAPEHGIRRFTLYATDDGRTLYEGNGFIHSTDWLELELPH